MAFRDLRVAAESAKLGELFLLRGLCCDVTGFGQLASLVGREKAAELLLTGDVIDAREDHREGARAFLEKRPPRFTGR